jgi:dipeptidyl-peptidase-4
LFRSRFVLALFVLSVCSGFVQAQQTGKKLTYEQAFLSREGGLMRFMMPATWFDDENYLVRERDEKTKSMSLYKVSAKTGEKTLFMDFSIIQKNFPQGFTAMMYAAATPDYTVFIYSYKNDLYLYSAKTQKFKRLTATAEEEKNPRLSPDAKWVAYTRANNLYACDLESGLEYQLTTDGSETIYNGYESWVYMEEISDRRSQYGAFWWSPDSSRIAFLRFDDSPVPTFPIFRASGVHGELEVERYPKAGDPNPKVKLGIVSLSDGKIVWADIDENADQYVAWPYWLPDGSRLTFQWMNRGQDNIKIYGVDPLTGKKEEIYDEKQPAWVEFFGDIYFLKDGSGFLLRSDVDGWNHLYYYDLKGQLKSRLTSGEWAVERIGLVDEKNKRVYFAAGKGKTTETHLFRVGLDGQGLEQLTKDPGTHFVSVSPGGSYYLDNFSSIDNPGKQDLYRSDGTWVRTTGQGQMQQLKEYTLGRKELFTIPTEDGLSLPASWILPPSFDQNKKYPVLFQVYGGPGSTDVSNSFPRLSSLYLAQEGILIFSVDHRGSAHFGKKGISLMHRNLGKWEMHDYIEAVKWLRQKPFVDSSKIGITGGSYGGYVTCMALTYGADYFTHGFAQYSVTDWKLYDSIYTERYMDKPEENKEGYEFGSVLTHAKKLKGVLDLEHGAMDDNVHMQNTVELIDVLMDNDKVFDFMLYPDQRHGFGGKKREISNRRYVDFWFKNFLNR